MVLLTKTAIRLGETTLTSVVDTDNNNSSSINLNVVDGLSSAFTFAQFHGTDSSLELLKPDGTSKGSLIANVDASTVHTDLVRVSDHLQLTDTAFIQFSGTVAGSITNANNLGVKIEEVAFNGKELSTDDLVLTGTNSLALKSDKLVIGSASGVGGQIISEANKITIDPSPIGTQGELVINGDLTVRGTQTSINSNTIELGDSTLELTGSAVTPSGLHIKIGSTERKIVWEETSSTWKLVDNNNNLLNLTAGVFHGEADRVSTLSNFTTSDLAEGSANLYYTDVRVNSAFDIRLGTKNTNNLVEGASNLYWTETRFTNSFNSKNTDALTEGSTNLYYTDARFNTAFGATDTDSLAEGSTNVYYTDARFNTAFGATDTDSLAEGSTNVYYTDSRVNTAFDIRLETKNTDNVAEGSTNLYYTDARFNTAFGATDTDALAEGSVNLYHTEARVHSSMSSGSGITVSAGEVSLGNHLKKKVVGSNVVDTESLLSLLTGILTPFSNTSAGGAVTLYVSAGNSTYTTMSMGIYHAVLINGVLNVVSQLEVSDPSGKVLLSVDEKNELTTTNNGTVDAHLSIRAVLQFDNQSHLF